MSGLLRRIKRSRAADAGEAPVEGVPVAPDAAPTPAEPAMTPAVIVVDPAVPAGLDPAEAPMRPPAGRRGRLRRRLRYLRRARELMLRDLGGLLYEIHRTGGGQLEPHATIIGAKVQRLAAVDAEAHAIEAALGAPRTETVVFQPGVGGTCQVCGELFGSDARFCSNCGATVQATAVPHVPGTAGDALAPAGEGRARTWPFRRRPKPPAEAPAVGEAAAAPSQDAARGEAAGAAHADDAPTETGETAQPAGDEAPTSVIGPADHAPDAERKPAAPGNPSNGRDEHRPGGLSPGDPLFTRERS